MPKLPADSVVLDVIFLSLPEHEHYIGHDIWQAADEQAIPPGLRKRLADNGIRCGMLSSRYPDSLNMLLAREQESREENSTRLADVLREQTSSHQRMSLREGQSGEIVASPSVIEQLVVLMIQDGSPIGQTFQQAQCQFQVRVQPQGDGRARVELLPVIHHGEPTTRFVGNPEQSTWTIQSGREKQAYRDLMIDSMLSPGQTLAIGPSADLRALGQHFFFHVRDELPRRRILLIRLAQSQLDDVFAPDRVRRPLVSVAP